MKMKKVQKLKGRTFVISFVLIFMTSALMDPSFALNQISTTSGTAFGISEGRTSYDCPAGYVITSVTIDMNDGHGVSGVGLNKSPKILNATCYSINDNLTLSGSSQTLNFGFGSAPTPAGTSSCSAGKVLNGLKIWGWLDTGATENFIADLATNCINPSTNSGDELNTNAFTNTTGFLGGEFVAPNFLGISSCSSGSLVTGINLSHGLYLHSISVRCSQFRSGPTDAQLAATKAAADAASAAAATAAQKARDDVQTLAIVVVALGAVASQIAGLSAGLLKRTTCVKGNKTVRVLATQSCPKGYKIKR
jgi:hypothetical protein